MVIQGSKAIGISVIALVCSVIVGQTVGASIAMILNKIMFGNEISFVRLARFPANLVMTLV